jgi:ABC-2 type transport system permease protein
LADHHGGAAAGREMLARFTVFGIMAPALFGFGITVALDRDRGLLQLKRALPMPPGAYLVSKLTMAMLFAAIISLALMLLAATVGQVVLFLVQWWALFVLAILGVVPFCSLGLLIGTLTKAQAAPAVVNLIYLPMSFLSGLLIPLEVLPHGLARIAPFLPAYHLAQVELAVIGVGSGGVAASQGGLASAASLPPTAGVPPGSGVHLEGIVWGGALNVHLLVLASTAVVFFLLAQRQLRRLG